MWDSSSVTSAALAKGDTTPADNERVSANAPARVSKKFFHMRANCVLGFQILSLFLYFDIPVQEYLGGEVVGVSSDVAACGERALGISLAVAFVVF